jgi:hypothetical protein
VTDDDAPAIRPDKALAAKRAEQMAYGRDHPAVQEVRPRSIVVGCVMTWVGAVVLMVYALLAVAVDENSSVFGDDMSQSDIETGVDAYHIIGVAFAIWSVLLIVFTLLALRGRQWAGTALLVMAIVVSVLALGSVFLTFSPGFFLTGAYSGLAGFLIRRNEPARNWYAARAVVRDANA